MRPSKLILRLCKKIEKDTGLICDPYTFRRTYAGYWQRSQGAFAWVIRAYGSYHEIGCCDPATEAVKKKYRLELLCDRDGWINEIVPERIKEG